MKYTRLLLLLTALSLPHSAAQSPDDSNPVRENSKGDYSSLTELEANETRGVDWDKYCIDRKSSVLIIAPHGRSIEPHTEMIAEKIAGDDFNLYVFLGLRKKVSGRPWLHVTSTRFEDSDLIGLLKKSNIAVSIHGCGKKYQEQATFIGGGNTVLKDKIRSSLQSHGFEVCDAPPGIGAKDRNNFVNKCGGDGGVQLEISGSERQSLADNPTRLKLYAESVRAVLKGMNNVAKPAGIR